MAAARPAAFQVVPLPRFPAVRRDLAILVGPEVTAADLGACLREAGGDLLADVRLFDVYRGDRVPEGSASYAYAPTRRPIAPSPTPR